MTAATSVSGVVPGLSRVFVRFPVCALAVVALCAVVNLDIAGTIELEDKLNSRAVIGIVAMFLAGGIGHLLAEGRGWTRFQNVALALGFAGLAGVGFLLEPAAAIDPLFLLPGLVLLLMVAAYARKEAQPDAFWLFNARLVIAAVVATAVGLLFGAGLWIVLQAYGYLFPPGPGDRWEAHAWAAAITLVGPICGLALIQSRLDESADPVSDRTLFGRVVAILAAWVLVPVMLAAAVLLHAYAAKVVWQWQLPDNEIGRIVLAYLAGGMAAWLIVQPWAERGNRLLRWFAASWLRLAVIPTALLGAAVARRLWAYGILPERYGLVLVALWVLAIAAHAAWIRGRPDPRVAVGVLGIALVACAFGPWGARGLSIRDQAARLAMVLETGGVVKDGRIVQPLPEGGIADRQAQRDAATIIDFLEEADALDRLAPLFKGLPDNPFAAAGTRPVTARKVADALGIGAPGREKAVPLRFVARMPAAIPVGDSATLIGPLDSADRSSAGRSGVLLAAGDLVISHGGVEWRVAGRELIAKLPPPPTGAELSGPVAVEIGGSPAARILVERLVADRGNRTVIRSARVWLILQNSKK